MALAIKLIILSRDEERELMRQWVNNQDRKARERLLESGIGLIWKIAWGYKGYGIPVEDLAQTGQLGLAEAFARYDPSRNTRLLTYTIWWIRAYILSYIISNFRIIGFGRGPFQSRVFFNLMKTMRRLQQNGASIDMEALASAMNVPISVVRSVAPRLLSQDCSLDAPRRKGGEEGYTLKTTLAADAPDPESLMVEAHTRATMQRIVSDGLAALDPREKLIIKGRMLTDPHLTLRELGRKLNVSRERVRQLEARAKDKFRAHIVNTYGETAVAILLG